MNDGSELDPEQLKNRVLQIDGSSRAINFPGRLVIPEARVNKENADLDFETVSPWFQFGWSNPFTTMEA